MMTSANLLDLVNIPGLNQVNIYCQEGLMEQVHLSSFLNMQPFFNYVCATTGQ